MKDIRWKQRFENFQKVFKQLSTAIDLEKDRNLSEIEQQGFIKAFEFTFELAWNVLKDYLQSQNVDAKFPREAIKQAFQHDLIKNGEIWLDMLEKRNLLAHTYEESRAITAIEVISKDYYPQIKKMNVLFEQIKNEE